MSTITDEQRINQLEATLREIENACDETLTVGHRILDARKPTKAALTFSLSVGRILAIARRNRVGGR